MWFAAITEWLIIFAIIHVLWKKHQQLDVYALLPAIVAGLSIALAAVFGFWHFSVGNLPTWAQALYQSMKELSGQLTTCLMILTIHWPLISKRKYQPFALTLVVAAFLSWLAHISLQISFMGSILVVLAALVGIVSSDRRAMKIAGLIVLLSTMVWPLFIADANIKAGLFHLCFAVFVAAQVASGSSFQFANQFREATE